MADFEKAIIKTLAYEGGYVNDPADPGGETNYGITKRTAIAHGYNGPMKELPLKVANEIYEKSYWIRNKLDQIESQEIAEYLFDIAVNSGSRTAGKMVQRIINLLEGGNLLTVDGEIGPLTVDKINEWSRKRVRELMVCLRGERYCLYRDIVNNTPSQRKFLIGWLRRA